MAQKEERVVVGAERIGDYIHLLEGHRVGVLTNHTGVVSKTTHLVDTLVGRGVDVRVIFAPEHGFRGDRAVGEHVPSGRDAYTGIEVVSLYGAGRKPKANDVFGCDVVVADLQDVGVRFYTYLSTLYLMMQTCADVGVELVVLDRPNPNGMIVDGPIIEEQYRSFVGMLPIPVLHGMTLGELARMINGQGWLGEGRKCRLTVVPCLNYYRSEQYELPVAPSPNLPNMLAVYLYPSLCFFEATGVSVGRGTDHPFQVYGHPSFDAEFSFTPRSLAHDGAPRLLLEGEECKGVDLRALDADSVIRNGIDLSYLIDAFERLGRNANYLSSYFEQLIGVGYVRDMLYGGASAEEIEQMWQADVANFLEQRTPYLIYQWEK